MKADNIDYIQGYRDAIEETTQKLSEYTQRHTNEDHIDLLKVYNDMVAYLIYKSIEVSSKEHSWIENNITPLIEPNPKQLNHLTLIKGKGSE